MTAINDGICIISWLSDCWLDDEGFCKDVSYTAGLHVVATGVRGEGLLLSVYRPQERLHDANCDCILESITGLTPSTYNRLSVQGQAPHGMPVSHVDDCFTVAA
jgi:hypothetical protein